MAKPITHYVLVRQGYSRYRGGFTVLGVTSEKGGQVYGRDERDHVTHVSARDVLHRFPDGTMREFAAAAGERATAEYARHEVAVRMAREELSRVEDLRQQRTLEAAKGVLTQTIKP